MANYPQEVAQNAVCQSHTGHMTGLWFLPARPLRLNTNELMNTKKKKERKVKVSLHLVNSKRLKRNLVPSHRKE